MRRFGSVASNLLTTLFAGLEICFQSGDDMILKRMKRRHSSDEAIAFCQEVRRLRPDMVFGADLIAGFVEKHSSGGGVS